MNSKFPVSTLILALLLMLGFMFVGCSSSKPKVDWNSRVGNYTYDQAVQELGPPDKTAKLTDGTIVSEWITAHHSSGTGLSVGTGFYGGGGGVGVSQGIGSGTSYDSVLKLTFTADGKLASWAKK
jgi:hypothetical protein